MVVGRKVGFRWRGGNAMALSGTGWDWVNYTARNQAVGRGIRSFSPKYTRNHKHRG